MHSIHIRRIALFTVIALTVGFVVAIGSIAIASGTSGIQPWFGFMGFDRSPHAVRERFNQLARDWVTSDERADPPFPVLVGAKRFGERGFQFTDANGDTEFSTPYARYSISGTMSFKGKAQRVGIEIDRTAPTVTEDYIRVSDRLIQLTLFSMFPQLPESTSRDLTLTFLYDVRPFNAVSNDQHLPQKSRTIHAVSNGRIFLLSAAATADDHLSFSIERQGMASKVQIDQCEQNYSCNRKLSQANSECSDMVDCLTWLTAALEKDNPNWADISALADQLDECVKVVDELCGSLSEYAKTKTYANRMKPNCVDFDTSAGLLFEAIDTQDLDSLKDVVDNIEGIVPILQNTIKVMYN